MKFQSHTKRSFARREFSPTHILQYLYEMLKLIILYINNCPNYTMNVNLSVCTPSNYEMANRTFGWPGQTKSLNAVLSQDDKYTN